MSNYTKTVIDKQNQNKSGFFVGSQSPHLTTTNKVNSNYRSTPVNPYYILELSDHLKKEFEQKSPMIFNEQIRRGWVRIKKINDNEFSVYKVCNRTGNTTLSTKSEASNSAKARFTAKNRLVEIIKANPEMCYFFTGTFDPKKWDRSNFRKLHSSLTHWLRRRGINYILVPEPHKDGSIHFHGFFDSSVEPYLAEFDIKHKLPSKIKQALKEDREIMNCPDYAKMFGWVSIERVRNLEASALYVAKYITKTFEDENSRFSYHRYFCSQGLKRPEFVLKSEINYSNYETKLSNYLPKVIYKRKSGGVGTAIPHVEAPPRSFGSGLASVYPQNFTP